LQRDLGLSRRGMGDALLALGDAEGALAAHRAALGTAERLAALDPANAEWQLDVVFGHGVLGEALLRAGDRAGAERQAARASQLARLWMERFPDGPRWGRTLPDADAIARGIGASGIGADAAAAPASAEDSR
jgi:hypothetical protein